VENLKFRAQDFSSDMPVYHFTDLLGLFSKLILDSDSIVTLSWTAYTGQALFADSKRIVESIQDLLR